MKTCQHRNPLYNTCDLLRRGGAAQEGFSLQCPTPDIRGAECSLATRLFNLREEGLGEAGRAGDATPDQIRKIEDEGLPSIVLNFCENQA